MFFDADAVGSALPSLKEVVIGQLVTAYVQAVKNDIAWLMVTPHLRGRLFVLDTSSNLSELEKFTERFPIGAAVSCRVKAIDTERGTLDFTLRDVPQKQEKSEFNVPPMEGEDSSNKNNDNQVFGFQKGDILCGRIARVSPGELSIKIAPTVFGRVHMTHISDVWKDDPIAGFKEGQFVRCVVLDFCKSKSGNTTVELTLRKSLGGSAPANLSDDDIDTARCECLTVLCSLEMLIVQL